MRRLEVTGTSPDGRSLVLRSGGEQFELSLDQLPTATPARVALPAANPGPAAPPRPREIQQRIRHGESSADIAAASGLTVEHVARYEGPVLAEREHHAQQARRAWVGGRLVGELVQEHFARLGPLDAPLVWDCWQTESGRWEVRVRSGRDGVRLSWDALARRVLALDEPARQALLLEPSPQDALDAVLRPHRRRTEGAGSRPAPARVEVVPPAGATPGPSLSPDGPTPGPLRPLPAEPAASESTASEASASEATASEGAAPAAGAPGGDAARAGNPDAGTSEASPEATPEAGLPASPPPRPGRRRSPGRRGRAEVPLWDDITTSVGGRRRPSEPEQEAR